MADIDRAEGLARRAGACLALGAAATAVPGLVRSVGLTGSVSGRPELIFTPRRLAVVSVGWFAAAAVAWHPLPLRPDRTARWALLAFGVTAYASGLAFAVAGRLALGSSYRPSSTIGATLAPDHRLVTSGPYGVVRHPMYLGLGLAAIGALALYRTWSTALFVAQLPVLVVRARREDALLAATFGERWRRYASAVPPWLPWSGGLGGRRRYNSAR